MARFFSTPPGAANLNRFYTKFATQPITRPIPHCTLSRSILLTLK